MTKSIGNNLGFPSEIIRFVGKKWVVPIFKEFDNITQIRFGDLKQKFGITSKVLSAVLGEMQSFGFIDKQDHKSFPPTITYTLSNRGSNLLDVIDMLEIFSKEFKIQENSDDNKYLTKFVIILAIEKSLSKMGRPELKRVEDKLLLDFNYTFEDCVSNPTPLKKVLCDLFGNSYDDIYSSIYDVLSDTSMDEDITKFLQTMKV